MNTTKTDTTSLKLPNITNQNRKITWVPRRLDIEIAFEKMWKNSNKDALRAFFILKNPNIINQWPLEKDPKNLRFPNANSEVNVSRSIGNHGINIAAHRKFLNSVEAISHKPKITINKVFSEDTLILACDGLKDYVTEKRITKILANLDQTSNAAQTLVEFALNKSNSLDNVSVLAIHIK